MRHTLNRYSLNFTCSYKFTRRSLYRASNLKAPDGIELKTANASYQVPPANVTPVQQNDADVVVIGAGLAGLSAANHLIKNGFHKTLVLEATDRYGGRINSKRFGDTYCELGAKWVNIDSTHDSMYELLCSATGLKKQIQQDNTTTYVHTSGQLIEPNMAQSINALFRSLCNGFYLTQKVKSGKDLQCLDSVMTYFSAESDKLIQTTFKAQEQPIARDIFKSLFNEFSSILGCCLEYVNIAHINNLPQPLQGELRPVYIPNGLDNVLKKITENIASENMQTGKPVGVIQWQTIGELGIQTGLGAAPDCFVIEPKCVSCLDGSIFSADHIICTLPLGVLKNFSHILFKPSLPCEKLLAIKNLGFGNPVRIYLEYKQPIDKWLKDNLRPLGNTMQTSVDKERVWTQNVIEVSKVPSSDRVIEIKVGGGFYEEIEKIPDAKLLEQITKLMRQCLAMVDVPYPDALLRSSWSTSACYLGGRPYYTVSSTSSDVQRLATPLGQPVPSLLFAGDATICNGFGTIDGARISGIREAQRLIDFYKHKQL